MKKFYKSIPIAVAASLILLLPPTVTASPGDDVTIRMMGINEFASESITSHIELPETVHRARQHSDNNVNTAASDHNTDLDQNKTHETDNDNRDHEMDMEGEREIAREDERDREMDREDEHEREMDVERDDRKDVEHAGIDREEIQREGFDDIDHSRENISPEFEAPTIETPEFEEPSQDRGTVDREQGEDISSHR